MIEKLVQWQIRPVVIVDPQTLNVAILPVINGDGSSDFYRKAKAVLIKTPGYHQMLDDAKLVDLDPKSLNAGFIAGLKAASGLLNINFEFVS